MVLRPTPLALLLAVPASALGQSIEPPPAHVAYVEGLATLGYEALESGTPLEPGDRLQTTRGRVEVFFVDGTTLYLNESTTVELIETDILRLTSGEITLDIPEHARQRTGRDVEVLTLAGPVLLDLPGEYRVTARDGGPIAAGWDRFARWIDDRRAQYAESASGGSLPAEVAAYGATLDRGGAWRTEAPYGAVWYPTVATDWRPYYNGRWVWLPRFGWTWVSDDPWGWPTHHYGRWDVSLQGRWFWVPGPQWAAAWVGWAIADGYVSWCALGVDSQPVVPFTRYRPHTRFVNERVFERDFTVNGRIFDPDFAWTTIRSRELGGPVPAQRIAVGGRRLVERDGVAFIEQRVPPRGPRTARGVRIPEPAASVEGPRRRAVVRPPAEADRAAATRTPGVPTRAGRVAVPAAPSRRPVVPRVSLPPPVAPLAPRRAAQPDEPVDRGASPRARLTPRGATRDGDTVDRAIPERPPVAVRPQRPGDSAPRPEPRTAQSRSGAPAAAPRGAPAPRGEGRPSAPAPRAGTQRRGGGAAEPRQAVPRPR